MATERKPAVQFADDELVPWVAQYAKQVKLSMADIVRLAVLEFRDRHDRTSGAGEHADKLDAALHLYRKANDSLQPGVLQRHGVAASYREAVGLIRELVDRGEIDGSRVTNIADMS